MHSLQIIISFVIWCLQIGVFVNEESRIVGNNGWTFAVVRVLPLFLLLSLPHSLLSRPSNRRLVGRLTCSALFPPPAVFSFHPSLDLSHRHPSLAQDPEIRRTSRHARRRSCLYNLLALCFCFAGRLQLIWSLRWRLFPEQSHCRPWCLRDVSPPLPFSTPSSNVAVRRQGFRNKHGTDWMANTNNLCSLFWIGSTAISVYTLRHYRFHGELPGYDKRPIANDNIDPDKAAFSMAPHDDDAYAPVQMDDNPEHHTDISYGGSASGTFSDNPYQPSGRYGSPDDDDPNRYGSLPSRHSPMFNPETEYGREATPAMTSARQPSPYGGGASSSPYAPPPATDDVVDDGGPVHFPPADYSRTLR